MRSNIERFALKIGKSRLPPTTWEAVLLTRRLLVRYLVIDGFCIVQKDVQEIRRLGRAEREVMDRTDAAYVAG